MGRRKGLPRNGTFEPQTVLSAKETRITIKNYHIYIDGTIEDAALALAEDILRRKKATPEATTFGYWSIDVSVKDGQIALDLKYQYAIDADNWKKLKKYTEKMCNNLTAFL